MSRLAALVVEGSMSPRKIVIRRGRHFGWWVEGQMASGGLFMKTWWPSRGSADLIARWTGGAPVQTDREIRSRRVVDTPPARACEDLLRHSFSTSKERARIAEIRGGTRRWRSC